MACYLLALFPTVLKTTCLGLGVGTKKHYSAENCHVGNYIARNFNFDGRRCCSNLAAQSELGILSKRRDRIDLAYLAHTYLDWPSADWAVEHLESANIQNNKD